MKDWVRVYKAESIIQREALLALLQEKGIEAITTPRDISRKIGDNTVDLAFGGYSAFFDGFSIFVNPSDEASAKEFIDEFLASLKNSQLSDVGEEAGPSTQHMRKFYFCAFFSVALPGLFHAIGIYHLVQAWRHKEKIEPLYFWVSLILFVVPIPIYWKMLL